MNSLTTYKALIAAVSMTAAINSADAAVATTYHGTFTVTTTGTVLPGSIATGDQYYFQFSVDPLVADSDSATDYALFDELITDLRVGKISGSGSWDLGSNSISGHSYGDTDKTALTLSLTSFAGSAVGYVNWKGETTQTNYLRFDLKIVQSSTDNGLGQRYWQTFPFLEPQGLSDVSAAIWVDNQKVSFTTTSFEEGAYTGPVPEPTSSTLALVAAGCAVLRRRRSA